MILLAEPEPAQRKSNAGGCHGRQGDLGHSLHFWALNLLRDTATERVCGREPRVPISHGLDIGTRWPDRELVSLAGRLCNQPCQWRSCHAPARNLHALIRSFDIEVKPRTILKTKKIRW